MQVTLTTRFDNLSVSFLLTHNMFKKFSNFFLHHENLSLSEELTNFLTKNMTKFKGVDKIFKENQRRTKGVKYNPNEYLYRSCCSSDRMHIDYNSYGAAKLNPGLLYGIQFKGNSHTFVGIALIFCFLDILLNHSKQPF